MHSTLFSEEWAMLAGSAVLNVVWQGMIVGVLAAVGLALTRDRSPNLRYALGCVGLFFIAVLLPLNLLLWGTVPAPAVSVAALEIEPEHVSVPQVPDLTAHPSPTAVQTPSAPQGNRSSRPRLSAAQWYHLCLPWVGRAWALGLVLFAIYDFAGMLALRRLHRRSQAVGGDIAVLAQRLQKQLGLKAQVQIRWLMGLSSAMVTGWFRTVILLPMSMATRMTPEEVEVILAHELAHIRRWDLWVNGFQCVVEALLFFHPVVWWLSATIRVERELCCDEAALRVCPDRARFVRALLCLAEGGQRQSAVALSSHGGDLVKRVRRILSQTQERKRTMQGRMITSIIALATVGLPVLVAFASSVSGAAALPERDLCFPENKTAGALQARWADRNYRKVPWLPDYTTGWTLLGDARGCITAPENALAKLTVSGTDLTFLRNLDPDALFCLDCRFQKLNDADVEPIALLTGLRALDLSDMPSLTGAALGRLGALRHLEWLDFQRTPIDNLPPNAFAQFPNLRYAAGHFKEYADDVARQLGALPRMEFICIKAGRVTADGLRHLSGKPSLRGLVLDNVELTDEALAALHSLPNLVYLDLRKNANLTDEGVEHLARIPSLTHLNLENCRITDRGVAHLAKNQALEEVYLSNTLVTEACLNSLALLPALHAAKLVETNVTETRAALFSASLASRAGYHVQPQQSSNPDAPKVGLVMSHFTATGPHRIHRPYGYSIQESRVTARALDEANFDVYAVVEPGTEYMGELPLILRETGLTDKTVNGFDADEMNGLDVIFLSSCPNVRNEMLRALDAAIQTGVGMVIISTFGALTPGESDPAVMMVSGLESAEYVWRGFRDSPCPVIDTHPILGNLPIGTLFTLNTLNGAKTQSGVIRNGTVLVEAPPDYPATFPVLYVRNHGRGRVVGCQWHRPLQAGIPFPGYTFYIRAINWAARRDVDAVWQG